MEDLVTLGLEWLCLGHSQATKIKVVQTDREIKLTWSCDLGGSSCPDFQWLFSLGHSFVKPSWPSSLWIPWDISIVPLCSRKGYQLVWNILFPRSGVTWDKLASGALLSDLGKGPIPERGFWIEVSLVSVPPCVTVEKEKSWHLASCQLLLETQMWTIYLQMTLTRWASPLR